MKTLILILLLWLPAAFAGESERLLSAIRTQFEAQAVWEIMFEHQVIPPASRDTSYSAGRLLACPDGSFRVDVEGLHLLSDGKSLWRWEDGGRQVLLERPGQSEDILLPHQLLILLEDRFKPVSLKADGASRRIIRLQPLAQSEFMRDVILTLKLQNKQWWPLEMVFTDFSDNRIRFLVVGRRSWPNRAIHQKELTFRMPDGMELIDLRGGAADATR